MTDYPGITDQYASLGSELGGLRLACLHLGDQSALGLAKPLLATINATRNNFRSAGGGGLILSGGYDLERAETDLQNGTAYLIAFGRPYIANPDLEKRLASNVELNTFDDATFYTADEKGYTDYPVMA